MNSQKRIDANRNNAQKSTGPRTQAGKERSSKNALKHGLRAEQVVLPTEDPQAFQEHLEAWVEDWQPPSMARRHLVEQAAVASWRIKRCIRLETTRISTRVEAAYGEWDGRVRDGIDAELGRLEEDPIGAIAELNSSRAGVDRLIREWNDIGDAASAPEGWREYNDHHFRLIGLLGHNAGDPEVKDAKDLSWRLILRNNPLDIEPGDPDPFDDDEAEVACDAIRALAAGRADELDRHRSALPDGTAARDRFAELKAFEPRKEDAVLLRYEGQQNRVFKTSLDQLMKLAQTGADVAEEESPNEATAVEPPAAVAPNEATAIEAKSPGRWASEPVAPNETKADCSDVLVDRVKRGPDGGIWSTVPVPLASIS
jgi:hypothetical protein